MPSADVFIKHLFGGGWATDFGPSVESSPDQNQILVIPYLLKAENTFFEADGGPHKIGGTTTLASALESGAVIRGIFDYWKQGTGGSPTRQHIVSVGTKVKADANDFSFSDIITGYASTGVHCYTTFDDLLIISSDGSSDDPYHYNQSAATAYLTGGGGDPRFSFSTVHKNYLFCAGDYANPSTLYYSVSEDPTDLQGAGSGSISVSPGDGDMITGVASYKNELWIFKGPYKGSIHRLSGSAPTGTDAFALQPFIRGIGCAWHNTIFPFQDDLGFMTPQGAFTSVKATASYGDFNEVSLSRFIAKFIKERVTKSRLRYCWAINDALNSRVFILLTVDSGTTNNFILIMDYREYPDRPVRWSYITAYDLGSIEIFTKSDGSKVLYGGGNDGIPRELLVAARSIDGSSSISWKVTTPYLSYGNSMVMKTFVNAGIGISPKGDYNITFTWVEDGQTSTSVDLSQAGNSDVLGAWASNQFTLGTSTLGGSEFMNVYTELAEEGGEFRSIQYEFTQNGVGEDAEIHAFTCGIIGGGLSTEN